MRNEKIGFVFQSFNLIPDLNLFDNVDVPLRYRGFNSAERKRRIEKVLETVGLASRMKHLPSQLSGGQQQRVAIARALAGEPRFLLADEPTGNLDSHMALSVMELISEINQSGTTIIMVTHDPALAEMASRNVHILDGRVSNGATGHQGRPSRHRLRRRSMFSYYLKLGWLSIRRNPLLSMLMIAAIAVGIGARMTIITVNYVMSGNPIPQKSDQLYYVQLDSWDPIDYDNEGFEPPDQMTYLDAMALMKAGKAYRQVASNRSGLVLEPQGEGERPFSVDTRNTWADFFPMFDLPFLYGSGWDDAADQNLERLLCSARKSMNGYLVARDSVGRSVRLNGMDFRVVGVIDEFLPMPKFYDVTTGAFDEPEEIFIPFNVAVEYELPRNGNTNCWKRRTVMALRHS